MQGFTTNPYETKESLLLRMNEVLVGGVSAGTLMGAINVIHDTRVYLNACEYGLRTRSESAAHAKLQVLAATLEKVRSLVSNQAFSPDVQSEIRDALYADFAGGEPGCQDGDMLVHWCTLQPHSAGRLGVFLALHLEHLQLPTKHVCTWFRYSCARVSHVPANLLVSTPLWLYRYFWADDQSHVSSCSPAYVLEPEPADFLCGLWAGSGERFERTLRAAHRLARAGMPSAVLGASRAFVS